MQRSKTRVPRAVAMLALLAALACATSRQEIRAEGDSEVTVTATSRLRFKATGPMTFPASWPAIGGMSLAPGQTIDVDLEPGESVTLKDKIRYDGQTVIVSSVTQKSAGAALTGQAVPSPAPTTWVTLSGQIQPGSTYTWTVPSFFGDNEAVVDVTGEVTGKALPSALVENDDGTWTLNPAGLAAFSYRVTGGAAVWQAPLDTPYGRIEGTGTIATDGGMVFTFTGDLSAVSGGGFEGYTADDGGVFEFGYTGAFPVRLSAGGGVAVGATTVWGGFDAD